MLCASHFHDLIPSPANSLRPSSSGFDCFLLFVVASPPVFICPPASDFLVQLSNLLLVQLSILSPSGLTIQPPSSGSTVRLPYGLIIQPLYGLTLWPPSSGSPVRSSGLQSPISDVPDFRLRPPAFVPLSIPSYGHTNWVVVSCTLSSLVPCGVH
jgi:hypothetical protein